MSSRSQREQVVVRVAPDGTIWMSELVGNRIIRHDPRTGTSDAFTMPTTHSGPRRFDVAPDGSLWIPAYGANLLVQFDPSIKRFTEHSIPVKDATPYIARVDRRGDVWLGLSAVDRVLRYRPSTQQWTSYALPTRGVMVRHMAFGKSDGEVWLAYGASPGSHPSRIARVVTN